MSTVNSKPSRLWGREEDRSGIQIPFIAFNLPSLTCISNCRSRNLLPTSSIVLQYLRDVTANLAELNFQESVTFKSQILKKASSYKYMIRTMIRNFHKEHDKLPTFEDLQIDAEHMKSAQWHLAVTSYVSKLALAKALLHIASKYHSRFKSRCLHAIFETKGISWLKELAYSSDRNGSARLSDTIGLQEDIMKMWTECYLELSPSELTAANKLQIKIDASSSTIAFFKGYENVFKESLPWSEIQTQPLRHILALRSILEILQDTPLPSLSAKVLTEISSPRLFDELQEVEERAEFGLLLEIIQSSCWHSLMFERGSSEVIDPLILLEKESNAPSKSKSARARARKKLESKTARKKLDSKTTLVSPLSTLKLLSLSSAVDSIHLPDSSLVEVEANGHIAMPELDDASDTSEEED